MVAIIAVVNTCDRCPVGSRVKNLESMWKHFYGEIRTTDRLMWIENCDRHQSLIGFCPQNVNIMGFRDSLKPLSIMREMNNFLVYMKLPRTKKNSLFLPLVFFDHQYNNTKKMLTSYIFYKKKCCVLHNSVFQSTTNGESFLPSELEKLIPSGVLSQFVYGLQILSEFDPSWLWVTISFACRDKSWSGLENFVFPSEYYRFHCWTSLTNFGMQLIF